MIALPMPGFYSIDVGSLFTLPSRPGYLFLKISAQLYVWDFDLMLAFGGWRNYGGRDVYHAAIDLRVNLLGHVTDENLVCDLYDAQIAARMDEWHQRRAYRTNPRVEPSRLTDEGECDE